MKCCAKNKSGSDCKYSSKFEVEGKHYCGIHKPSEQCPICFGHISSQSKTTTSCKHVFHRACLERWTEENSTCPLCRHEIAPKQPRVMSIISTTDPSEIPVWEMLLLVENFTNNLQVENVNGIWMSHLEY